MWAIRPYLYFQRRPVPFWESRRVRAFYGVSIDCCYLWTLCIADCEGRLNCISIALNHVATVLAATGFEEPRRQARRLLAAALSLSPAEVFAHPERRLAAARRASRS